jgi:endonuclease YncB( thermonuclease family)
MRLSRVFSVVALTVLLIVAFTPVVPSQETVGIHGDFPHARVIVTEVTDGDTIRISPPVLVAGEYRLVVRLADINAPELTTSEGQWARGNLTNLLAQYGGVVYLDIDKKYGVDDHGRVVAVVYVRVNDTHLLNVNKWMLENGYAEVEDLDNDFDPSKWSLYVHYPVESEKLPSISRVVLASLPQGISYGLSWGVKVAVTPDGNYVGVAFSEYNTYHLWVVILDKYGNIVRRVNLSEVAVQYRIPHTNVFRGMVSIAANDSGFLVVWNQFSATIGGTTYPRIAMYTYVPIDPNAEIPYDRVRNQWFFLYSGSYQYHPHATWYCDANGDSNGDCYWIIGYHFISTTLSGRVFCFAVKPDLVTKIPATGKAVVLTPRVATTDPTGIAVGIDAMSGVLYDPATKSFVWVSRNYTATTGYDLEVVKGSVVGTALSIARIPVNNSVGDVGPSAELYVSGGRYYTYNNVYPMHSALLYGGGWLATIYNVSATEMGISLVNLADGSVRGYVIPTGITLPTTFYPWIAGGENEFLAVFSGRGYVYAVRVDTTSGPSGVVTIADRNAGYVRVAYDPGAKLFPVVYGVRDLSTGNFNVFLTVGGNFVIPVNTNGAIDKRPINIVVLPGASPGRLVVFTVEGKDLVAYYVSPDYPESQQPIPIPEPTLVSIAVAATAGAVTAYTVHRARSKRREE